MIEIKSKDVPNELSTLAVKIEMTYRKIRRREDENL